MKTIKDYINIDESRTTTQNIINYGRTWISEWGVEHCGDVLSWFIEGVKDGVKKYKTEDKEFNTSCESCIDEIMKTLEKYFNA